MLQITLSAATNFIFRPDNEWILTIDKYDQFWRHYESLFPSMEQHVFIVFLKLIENTEIRYLSRAWNDSQVF